MPVAVASAGWQAQPAKVCVRWWLRHSGARARPGRPGRRPGQRVVQMSQRRGRPPHTGDARGPGRVQHLSRIARGGRSRRCVLTVRSTTVLIVLARVRTATLIRAEERRPSWTSKWPATPLTTPPTPSRVLANVSQLARPPPDGAGNRGPRGHGAPRRPGLLTRMRGSGQGSGAHGRGGNLDFVGGVEAGQIERSPRSRSTWALSWSTPLTATCQARRPRGCRLRVATWTRTAPHTMVGDSGRLFQVLTNLLDNAFKFTHEGRGPERPPRGTPPTSALRADGSSSSSNDTGIGISEADQESVFESFQQVGRLDDQALRRRRPRPRDLQGADVLHGRHPQLAQSTR